MRSKLILIIAVTVIFSTSVIFSSCGTAMKYPSVSERKTLTRNPGQVVWRDLVTPDPKLSAEFYKKVFGWTVEQVGTDEVPYWIFSNNGKRIAGMFHMTEAKSNAGAEWISYISVPDVNTAAGKIKAAGGNVLKGPVEMEGRGMTALIADPKRAIVAIIRTADGDPPVNYQPVTNEWLWSELWANDPGTESKFYADLLSGVVDKKSVDDREYILVEKDGRRCMGVIESPAMNTRSHWLQYIKVSDIATTLKNIVDAGGKVLIPSDEKIRNGSVAVVIDPSGAPFAVQLWPYK